MMILLPSRFAIPSGTLRRTIWLCAFMLIVLRVSRNAASDDWIQPNLAGATWMRTIDSDQPRRLPPVDSVSYEVATSDQPLMPLEMSFGYDNGFVLAGYGAECGWSGEYPFLMRMNSWFQLRHTLFDSNGLNPDQNTVSFERLRLSFGGHAFTPDLKYFFQIDGNSDVSVERIFLDHFVTYDLGHAVLGCEKGKLGIKAGKWKVPFSRSREESGRRLQFTDRTTTNVFFDLNRAVGAGLYGRCDPFAVPVHFETAVFNGFRTRNTSTNRGGGLDRNLGWSLRTYTDLLGDFGKDGEPDLSYHTAPALRLGGGLAHSCVDREGTSEFRRLSVVDSGLPLDTLLPANVSSYDVSLCTVDSHFKYHGFSFIAEYYWRHITGFRGEDIPGLFDHGFVLQTGYFIFPKRLELLVRWARIAGESGTLGLMDQSSDEVGAGLAWYIKGHNAKLVFDATHHNGASITESRVDTLAGDIGWLFRTQFQLAF